MKYTSLIFSILILILMFSCGTKKKLPVDMHGLKVNFVQNETLDQVLKRAKKEDKLIFMDFMASWCLPCQLMNEEVFTHQETADFLNENFINFKIDGERGYGPEIMANYRVQAYPTLIFTDAEGNVLERKMGAAFHSELREMGERALTEAGMLP